MAPGVFLLNFGMHIICFEIESWAEPDNDEGGLITVTTHPSDSF